MEEITKEDLDFLNSFFFEATNSKIYNDIKRNYEKGRREYLPPGKRKAFTDESPMYAKEVW